MKRLPKALQDNADVSKENTATRYGNCVHEIHKSPLPARSVVRTLRLCTGWWASRRLRPCSRKHECAGRMGRPRGRQLVNASQEGTRVSLATTRGVHQPPYRCCQKANNRSEMQPKVECMRISTQVAKTGKSPLATRCVVTDVHGGDAICTQKL